MKYSLLAALLSTSLLSGALVTAPAAMAGDMAFPHLETVGVSELALEADMAELSVQVTVKDKTPKAAKGASDLAVAKFIARLKAAGIDRELIQSANLNLQPQYHYEKNQPSELIGYSANRKITVTVKDLARLNEILDSALEEGINRVNNISLKSSKQDEMVAKVRQAAIVDARQKAQLLAEGFGERLDGVWEIRYFEQYPVQPLMMRMSTQADSGVAESYRNDRITIRDRVEVVYRLK